MKPYFKENEKLFSKDYNLIKNSHPIIVGCGGLGGYVAHGLTRLGVKTLTIVDFDVFEISNFNRQLFSTIETVGASKVDCLKKELLKINPDLIIITHKQTIESLFTSDTYTMIIDCVDKVKTKIYLEALSNKLDIPLLHGAIGGWFGQYGLLLPNSNILKSTYDDTKETLEKSLGSPTFTPGVIAHLMVNEYAKYYTYKDNALINQLMMVDLKTLSFEVFYKNKVNRG